MEESETRGQGPRILVRLVLAIVLVAGIVWAIANREAIDPQSIRLFVDSLGMWAAAGFIAAYVVAALFFLPGSAMTLAAGALFGPVEGTIYSLVGATLGASAALVVARYVAGDWVRGKVSGRLETLIAGVEAEGWKFVAFTRLVPIFPYNLLNYAFGLTRIKVSHFALASFVTMAPGAAAYAYLGHAGHQLAAGTEDAIRTTLFALGAFAVLTFLSTLVKRYWGRKPDLVSADELAEMLDSGAGVGVLDVRSPEEFGGPLGCVDGARNIPVDELGSRLDEISEWREVPVVIVCRTDRRSAKAATILARAGFEDLQVLAGGMTQWSERSAEP